MKKQPERTARTRQRIIDAFWELYRENSIDKITIKEITGGAGLYRSTFYEYFSDVYEILEKIEDDLIDQIHEIIPAVLGSENFEDAIGSLLSFYDSNGDRLAVLLGPNGSQRFSIRVKKLTKDAFYEKTKSVENDLDTEILFTLVSSSIITLLEFWYENRDRLSIQEVLLTGSGFLQNGTVSFLKAAGVKFLR